MHVVSPPYVPFVPIRVIVSLSLALLALRAPAADGPDELKAQTDRWIGLEKSIADERNEWRSQKEALESSIQVLGTEQTHLQERLAANELAAAAFKKRLDQAQAEQVDQNAAHQALLQRCATLEGRLRPLTQRLPEPLRERLAPLLEKLDRAGSDEVTTAERTQTLVSILTAIEQFNNTLTLTHQLRKNPAGETLDVKVLYWGMAVAYAVDQPGENAWVVTPGPTAWEWRDAPDNVRAIRALIDVYEKQGGPKLVMVPTGSTGGAQ